MHKIIIAALFVFSLSNCATTNQYGNFVSQAPASDQRRLAREAVHQLVSLYPPAQTRLELYQATPDAFGKTLVLTLREHGYALLEFNTARAKARTKTSSLAVSSVIPLRYVFDQADNSGLYHLTLLVGNQSITRPYLIQNGHFSPIGYWVRKEP